MFPSSIRHFLASSLLFTVSLLFSAASFAAPQLKVYSVTNVKVGDSLNMRAWPSTKSRVILAIPHNAKWVASTQKPVKKGTSNWQKVIWNGVTGWVNTSYLKYDPVSTRKALQRRDHRLKVQGKSRNVARSTVASRAPTANRNSASKKSSTRKVVMECGGNSPFWKVSMDFTGKRMEVSHPNGRPAFNTPVYFRKWLRDSNKMIVNGGRGRNAVRATLTKTNACTDGITNIKYPFAVDATIGGNQKVSGCCRSVQH